VLHFTHLVFYHFYLCFKTNLLLKFVDTVGGEKLFNDVVDTSKKHWDSDISANSQKKFKIAQTQKSGTEGKQIHRKNLKTTILSPCRM